MLISRMINTVLLLCQPEGSAIGHLYDLRQTIKLTFTTTFALTKQVDWSRGIPMSADV